MLDPRLCFFRRQQFYKCGSFQIKEPALIHQTSGGELTATHYVRDFAADQIIVLRNEVAFAHVNQHSLERCWKGADEILGTLEHELYKKGKSLGVDKKTLKAILMKMAK